MPLLFLLLPATAAAFYSKKPKPLYPNVEYFLFRSICFKCFYEQQLTLKFPIFAKYPCLYNAVFGNRF